MISSIFSLLENWKYTLKTLNKNKARSLLTALGIIIGVWAVIVLIAIGNGLRVYINNQFESLGSNSIYVMPLNQAQLKGQAGGFAGNFSTSFNLDDAQKIEKLDSVRLAVPANTISAMVAHGKEEWFAEVVGSTHRFSEANNIKTVAGKFFSSAEEKRGKSVAVIGATVKKELFGDDTPNESVIDKKIKIDKKIFKIIGVLEEKGGGSLGSNQIDNHVVIPYKNLWRITDKKEFTLIIAVAASKDQIEQAKADIKKVMAKSYDEDDFSVIDQSELLGTINKILGVFTLGLSGIAAISLIVGGVGIMNVMLVSVRERTKEVGLRKAVGATNGNILFQFLCESVILSLFGGIIGLILAIITTLIINKFFPATIAVWSIGLALLVSIGVGVIFGITPARKASKLAPVEALRYE